MTDSSTYGADSIQVLEGLDAVQKRPGMYIGSTDSRGLHHLIYEVVDNSIDEAMAGECDDITVTLTPDGSVTVVDNGRGIPIDAYGDSGKSTVEVILTELHAGGKFDSETYDTSGGLHGVGVSVVNALSEFLKVRIKRNGKMWSQTYSHGEPQTELSPIADLEDSAETGTEVEFIPDAFVFETTDFNFETLADRFRELAFLNPSVELTLRDERDSTEDPRIESFKYSGGITEYVNFLNEGRNSLHEPIYFEDVEDDIAVEVAIQVTDAVQPIIHGFTNNIHTKEGGTHLTGFKQAFTRAVNSYGDEHNMYGDLDDTPTGDDVREGVTVVISVKHPDPQFEGQTKTKLGNSEVSGIVASSTTDAISTFFEENPTIAETIVQQTIQATKARKAATKAQQLTRRKSALQSTSLPGKLTDCQSTDPDESELFILEGDSAGGSGKQGRDPETQAILPLKGKILNVERHRLDKILENTEIQNLITAIGTGIGDEFDIEDARYKNIIILTDADVDGAHIRTLLLTFLYRYMRPLIEAGYVYAAKPPLYRIKKSGTTYDAMNDAEKEEIIRDTCNGSPDSVQRFKGLGEMNPTQLWDSTMDPDTRWLKRVTVSDGAKADSVFSILMGDQVQPRKEFIRDHASTAEWVDI